MNEEDSDITLSKPSSPRDLFPGFYRPSDAERADAYARGLVSLDANALLDLYRFTPKAREEFFRVLELLRCRIFITHQAALEFQDNRLSVVDDRIDVSRKECDEIRKQLTQVQERIRSFSNRHQVDPAESSSLISMVEELTDTLSKAIREAGTYDLDREEVKSARDSVIVRLDSLLNGRVGEPMNERDHQEAILEADRRRREKIPPGYADSRKTNSNETAGDYLVWRQLLDEARNHGRPVLLVCNEKKEDWVRKGAANEILGPRPELVLEMKQSSGVALHLVTVVGLLKEAPELIGATVSDSTIREAESLPVNKIVWVTFTQQAMNAYDSMTSEEQDQFTAAVGRMRDAIHNDLPMIDLADFVKPVSSEAVGLYLLRWSASGRAVLKTVMHERAEGVATPIGIDLIVTRILRRDDEFVGTGTDG